MTTRDGGTCLRIARTLTPAAAVALNVPPDLTPVDAEAEENHRVGSHHALTQASPTPHLPSKLLKTLCYLYADCRLAGS